MTAIAERVRGLPIWSGPVEPVQLHGGLSTTTFLVNDRGRRVVARVGGDLPQHDVSRERELAAARAAHAIGLAPAVVHAEPGLMVTEFIDGQTFAGADVRANIYPVAELIRTFHQRMAVVMAGAQFRFVPADIIESYWRRIDLENQRRLAPFRQLATRVLERRETRPDVFGHNDLLPANILNDGARLWLIDFEYAGFASPAFDLAGVAANSQLSDQEDRDLLTAYAGHTPNLDMLADHSAMKCIAALRECLWCMVSELDPPAEGVDYAACTAATFDTLETSFDDHATRFGAM